MRWNLKSSGALTLKGLTDEDGAVVNTAVCTLEIVAGDDGAPIANSPLTGEYVPASQGDYRFRIPADIDMVDGAVYKGKLTATAAGDDGPIVLYREIRIVASTPE